MTTLDQTNEYNLSKFFWNNFLVGYAIVFKFGSYYLWLFVLGG